VIGIREMCNDYRLKVDLASIVDGSPRDDVKITDVAPVDMPALGALRVWSERPDQHVILPVIGIDGARVTAGTASDVDRPHARRSHLSERNGLAGWLRAHPE
jgi:hypothetical protein